MSHFCAILAHLFYHSLEEWPALVFLELLLVLEAACYLYYDLAIFFLITVIQPSYFYEYTNKSVG